MRRTAGFSLVEALVAVSIFGVALAAIVPSFVFFSRSNLSSQRRTEAAAIAQQVVDGLRQKDFATWDPSGESYTLSAGGGDYKAELTYCTGTLTLCNSGARHLRVEVKQHGKTYYEVETVFTAFNTN